jgi:cyclic-di-AMP phosphodiesterase PgpH
LFLLDDLREKMGDRLSQGYLKNARIRRVLWGILFFALLSLLLAGQTVPQRLDLQVGDVAPQDLNAPREIENTVATQRKRQQAMEAIPPQRRIDPAVQQAAAEWVRGVFGPIRTARELGGEETWRLEQLQARLEIGMALSVQVLQAVLRATNEQIDQAEQETISLIERILGSRVDTPDVSDLRAKVEIETPPYQAVLTDPRLRPLVKELVKSRIQSNLVDDPEATARARDQAAEAVSPEIKKKGEVILEKNKRVTEEQYRMLVDLGLIGPRADIRAMVGTALLAALAVALIALYLHRYRPDLLRKDSQILLLGILGLLTLGLCLLVKSFEPSLGGSVGYLMPVPVGAMLVTILMDAKVAVLLSVLVSILAGLATPGDQLSYTLVAIAGSLVGIYSVAKVEQRGDLIRAGLYIGGANAVTILALNLINAFSFLDLRVWTEAGVGALNGLVSAILTIGSLPFLENIFGVLTPLKLLELSNPNHPLLKRLLVEAPGSYHHTVMVANLCEAAAEATGSNQIIARVGAMYHDIGKVKRPYFFVENQFGGENPHDKLPPSLSAMIITSHVKDGLEMAREARLPKEIIDFISEHHGTMLVSYFYHKASQTGQSEYVLEEDFRYDGPKPQTKETAICMLADGCEASVRALRQRGPLTEDQIRQQVRNIINDRLKQGQLDSCDLTLRDLDIIEKTYVRVLYSVHHARIEYPTGAANFAGTKGEGAQHADPGRERAESDPDPAKPGANRPAGGGKEHPGGSAASR